MAAHGRALAFQLDLLSILMSETEAGIPVARAGESPGDGLGTECSLLSDSFASFGSVELLRTSLTRSGLDRRREAT